VRLQPDRFLFERDRRRLARAAPAGEGSDFRLTFSKI
jgi:hypothetical protein